MLISDSKGLYDALRNELGTADKLTALECPIIEDNLKHMQGSMKWIPHDKNPVDCLTKTKNAHLAPLIKLMETGMFTLVEENKELEERRKTKELTGKRSRIKTSATSVRNATAKTE